MGKFGGLVISAGGLERAMIAFEEPSIENIILSTCAHR